MARSYAKLYVSIWSSDFRALARDDQHLYFLLISNPKLSPAGCVVCQPRKWAKYADGCTAADISSALGRLADARYVLTDDDTEEVLIRSFIRHDRGYRNQYLRKSIETAITAIESPALREAARLELAVAIEDEASPQVEDPDQDSYEDPSNDSYEVSGQATYEANYSPTPSPATSTSSSSQHRRGESVEGTSTPVMSDAAAAALEILIEHKCASARTTGLRFTLQRDLPIEHGSAIAAYQAANPAATASDIARDVLKVPGILGAPAPCAPTWHYDPNCPDHDPSDGMVASPDGGAGTLTPCHCRSADPYPAQLATVTELRTA